MNRKLALGLCSAVVVGLNVLHSSALKAEESPKCPFVPCATQGACTVHSGCAGCFAWPGFVNGVCLSWN